jgi:hypothetical protein
MRRAKPARAGAAGKHRSLRRVAASCDDDCPIGDRKSWRCRRPILGNAVVIGAVFLTGISAPGAASGDQLRSTGAGDSMSRGSCQSPGRALAALPPAYAAAPPNSIVLPDINVFGLKIHLHPYSTPGVGSCVSSFGRIRDEHYEVPSDFDVNTPLHPYTSGIGPWPGARGQRDLYGR